MLPCMISGPAGVGYGDRPSSRVGRQATGPSSVVCPPTSSAGKFLHESAFGISGAAASRSARRTVIPCDPKPAMGPVSPPRESECR